MKLRHDFAGHYNRADIFQMHINRTAPHLYTAHEEAESSAEEEITAPAAPGSDDTQSGDAESPKQIAQIIPARTGGGKK
jgi:hypothetical protein